MFHDTVQSWGFERLQNEWCVYCRVSDTGTTIFALHVHQEIVGRLKNCLNHLIFP